MKRVLQSIIKWGKKLWRNSQEQVGMDEWVWNKVTERRQSIKLSTALKNEKRPLQLNLKCNSNAIIPVPEKAVICTFFKGQKIYSEIGWWEWRWQEARLTCKGDVPTSCPSVLTCDSCHFRVINMLHVFRRLQNRMRFSTSSNVFLFFFTYH